MHSNTPIGLGSGQRPFQAPQAHSHSGHPHQVKTEAGGESKEFSSQASNSPQQVLNQQILATLNEHLEINGAARIETLDASEFTPEKVADRILGFIGAALNMAKSKGADEEKLQEIMAQVRKGVEEGFKEARGILEGLGILKGEIKANADKTYDLIQQGLDRLEGKSPEPVAAPQSSESLQIATSNQQGRSLSLQVRTQDGDVVTLNIESIRSQSQNLSYAQNGSGFQFSTSQQTQSRDSIQYSVEGDLNEGEQQALAELIDRVDQFSNKFFEGDISNILQHVSDLGFDEGEIAGFSLSLTQIETSSASLAYKNVAQLGANEGNNAPNSQDRQIPALADFLKGFADLLSEFRASPLFVEPDKALFDLLDQRIELDNRAEQLADNLGKDKKADDIDKLIQIADAILDA